MGSTAVNEKNPVTETITTSSNTNIVQVKNSGLQGADAVALTSALGGALNTGLASVTESERAFLAASFGSLQALGLGQLGAVQTLAAQQTAALTGSQLETGAAPRSITAGAQGTELFGTTIVTPLLIAAAVIAVAFIFRGGQNVK